MPTFNAPVQDPNAPAGMQPVPGKPGYYYLPGTNYVVTVSTDEFGRQTLNELPLSVGKSLLGSAGVEDGGGSRLASDDPRYWEFQYAQLDQDERQFVRNLEYQYRNSGLDAESARQQALASLIQSRNRNQIDLASVYGQNAAQAAKFASAPEDTYADLLFRNAIGGATPFGAMSSNPEATDARKTALEAKFQELFGPTAQALTRAGEFIAAPPPTEFFGPEIRAQLGLPPTPAGGLAAGGGAGAVTSPAAVAPASNTDLQGALQFIQGAQQDPRGQQGFAEDLLKWATAANGGVQPTTAEDGVNMNIMEPAMIVGQSGRVYATMSEKDPEQLIVKPLPSVRERQKKEKDQSKNFMKATEGITRMQEGGTINTIPDFSDLFRETRKALQPLGGAYGGIGFQGGGTGVLPDLRFLAGAPFEALQDDPRLLKQVMAGYRTAEGGAIDPETFLSTIKKFTPKGISYNTPRVAFA